MMSDQVHDHMATTACPACQMPPIPSRAEQRLWESTPARRFRVRWVELALAVTVGLLVVALLGWMWAIVPDEPVSQPAGQSVTVPTWDDPVVVTGEDGAPVAVVEATPEPLPPCTDTIAEAGGMCEGPLRPDWAPDGMPPCITEDSMNCWWDAAIQGNGEGRSFIAQDGFIIWMDGQPAPEAEPSQPGTPTPATPAPTTTPAAPVVNEDPDYTLETWPFSTGETIVCGQGAKPALDYSDDPEIGWWAYCESALVD